MSHKATLLTAAQADAAQHLTLAGYPCRWSIGPLGPDRLELLPRDGARIVYRAPDSCRAWIEFTDPPTLTGARLMSDAPPGKRYQRTHFLSPFFLLVEHLCE